MILFRRALAVVLAAALAIAAPGLPCRQAMAAVGLSASLGVGGGPSWIPFSSVSENAFKALHGSLASLDLGPETLAALATLDAGSETARQAVGAVAARLPADFDAQAAEGNSEVEVAYWQARPEVERLVKRRVSEVAQAVSEGRMGADELAVAAAELNAFGFFGSSVQEEIIIVDEMARASRSDRTLGTARQIADKLLKGKTTIGSESGPAEVLVPDRRQPKGGKVSLAAAAPEKPVESGAAAVEIQSVPGGLAGAPLSVESIQDDFAPKGDTGGGWAAKKAADRTPGDGIVRKRSVSRAYLTVALILLTGLAAFAPSARRALERVFSEEKMDYSQYAPETADFIRGLRAKDPKVRKSTARDLISALQGGKKGLEATVPVLTEALRKAQWGESYVFAQALERFGPKAAIAVPAILDAVAQRRLGGESFEYMGPNAVPALVQGLKLHNRDARWLAVATLHRMGPAAADAAPTLVDIALNDSDPWIRMVAWETLGETGAPAVGPLTKILESKREDVKMDFVSRALSRAQLMAEREREMSAFFAGLMEAKDPDAASAFEYLDAIGARPKIKDAATIDEESIRMLIKSLKHSNRHVRRGAAMTLGNLGWIRAYNAKGALEEASKNDPDAYMRELSLEALEQLEWPFPPPKNMFNPDPDETFPRLL